MGAGLLLLVLGAGLYFASSASKGAPKPPGTKPPGKTPGKKPPATKPPKDEPDVEPPQDDPPTVEPTPVVRALHVGDNGGVTLGSDQYLQVMLNPEIGSLIEMLSTNQDVIESETYSGTSPVVVEQEPKGPGATSLTFRWYRAESTGEIDSGTLAVTATDTPRAVGTEHE